jgi:hypothetical protein
MPTKRGSKGSPGEPAATNAAWKVEAAAELANHPASLPELWRPRANRRIAAGCPQNK